MTIDWYRSVISVQVMFHLAVARTLLRLLGSPEIDML